MLKKYRPRTPGTRKLILVKHDQLTRVEGGRKHVKPEKSLLRPKKRTNGRNNKGRITCRHRGGGHKRRYRVIDFVRDKEEIPARVASIEYDPNRSAYIALLNYKDGEKRYILAPDGLKVGDEVKTSRTPPYAVGCCMRLKDIPEGSAVHNIELYPGRGGQFVRSAGLSAQHMGCSGGYAKIRLPSGEVRSFHEECKAVIGEVSNKSHSGKVLGKAGRSRWMGRRPTVRGVAMNPVDHPHGGGEGKSKGNIEQSFSGVYVGMRTRSVKKSNKFIDTDRRKK